MKETRAHVLLLLVLTFALYAPTLRYPFVNFDDPGIVLGNPVLRENSVDAWVSAATERQGGTFLPVRALSYKIDFAFTEGNPLVFHAHNVLLAGVLHVLAYFVLLGFFRDPRAALAGAILYAVHPVHVESVAWVTGRKDLLSSIFALAALLCFRRARVREPASLAPAALALFVLAALSKATVLVLPLWLVLEEFLAPRKEGEPARRRWLAGPCPP
ncbi:MAG: glycosyltransferase family 39 protein, partial [Planctomycetota bacterium]